MDVHKWQSSTTASGPRASGPRHAKQYVYVLRDGIYSCTPICRPPAGSSATSSKSFNSPARRGLTASHASVSTPASSAPISSRSQAIKLDGIVVTRKSDPNAPISKSRPKPTSRSTDVAEDDDADNEDDDADNEEPAIGGLQDEDELLEQSAALASPLKGMDARDIAKVNLMRVLSPFFS